MRFISVKVRITLGLVLILLTAMVMVSAIGVGPNPRQQELTRRASLSESIAVGTSLFLTDGRKDKIQTFLDAVTKRNPDIISTGLRRSDGKLILFAGDHPNTWQAERPDSVETQLHVPLKDGNYDWGGVEICFRPLRPSGWIGLMTNRWVAYYASVAGVTFVLFSWFLGKVLRQLNPSKAVPKRVREALDQLAEGLLITNQKGETVFCNEKFASWSGEDSERLVGIKATKYPISLAEDEIDQRLPWERAIQDRTPQSSVPLVLKDKSGRELQLSANSSPIIGTDGNYRAVLTSFDDVTELTEHKQQLSRARDAAERANKEKSDFLARMSHEIRTPMNAILGYTEVLRRGFEQTEEQRQKHLSTIQASGEHLLSLINDILDLSKIEAGRIELERAPCSLHEVVSQVAAVFAPAAKAKGVDFSIEFRGRLPRTIVTDVVRLRQIIINLVGNAMKFTEQGSVRLVTRLDALAHPPKIAFDVIDTGIGMTQEAVGKIFEPFAQADMTITRRFGGTGLGLSISRQLAEAMGGEINVTSELGKGSTFTVAIDPGPLDGVEMVEFECLSEIKPTEKEQDVTISLDGNRILVVDDGETNRQLAALFLTRAGADVQLAENGQVAIDLLEQGHYDAVLMDMQMPVLDGVRATQILRERGFDMPIVALTANAMVEDRKTCLAAGFTDFLAKPIDMSRLLRTLAKVIPSQIVKKEAASIPRTENKSAAKPSANEPSASESAKKNLPDFIESELPIDDEDFLEIVELFVVRVQEQIEAMARAIEIEDFEEVARLGHWLKGSGGSAGFPTLLSLGKQLEVAAKDAKAGQVDQVFEQIRATVARIRVRRESATQEANRVNEDPAVTA